MTTKYDMTSGERINRSGQSSAAAPEPYRPIELTLSLQLVMAGNQQKPKLIPPDMASYSISGFLKPQG